ASGDLLILIVDGREGLVAGDERIARELRETGHPVLLAINKTDDKRARDASLEFYRLGFEPVFEISAEHGTGVADLLDEIITNLGAASQQEPSAQSLPPVPDETGIAIVGRPNVGKSSLVNRLLHAERVLVSET